MNKEKLLSNKTTFTNWCNKYIKREGIDDLLKYLETETDFFIAPASTKYHLSEDGGLCQHSINVFRNMIKICSNYEKEQCENNDDFKESLCIVALFHDLCKTNFYLQTEKYYGGKPNLTYVIKDDFPLGHGEKSLFIISKFLKLTNDEALAIRWHMGFSDTAAQKNPNLVSNAFEKSKLAVYLSVADTLSTFVHESDIVSK